MGMKTVALSSAAALSLAGAALVPFTTYYPYFVIAKPDGVDDCVVANVGAVTSAWTPTCAPDLPQVNFSVPTAEFWPLFPVNNPTADGNPLGDIYKGANYTEFDNCETAVGTATGTIQLLVGTIPDVLAAAAGAPKEELASGIKTAAEQNLATKPDATDPADQAQRFLNFLTSALEEVNPATVNFEDIGRAIALLGQCYCNYEAPDGLYTLTVGPAETVVPTANPCPPGVEDDRVALYGAFGIDAPTAPGVLECFADQAVYQGIKNVASAFNVPANSTEALKEACEDDQKDIEAITLAALMLNVSTGLAGASFLVTLGALATKSSPVAAIAALLSFATCGITVFALLTVRGAPIYEAVGRAQCDICYSNNISFYTGLGAIATPGLAGLILLASMACAAADDEESDALVNKLEEEP